MGNDDVLNTIPSVSAQSAHIKCLLQYLDITVYYFIIGLQIQCHLHHVFALNHDYKVSFSVILFM